jgi:hypothetical protein
LPIHTLTELLIEFKRNYTARGQYQINSTFSPVIPAAYGTVQTIEKQLFILRNNSLSKEQQMPDSLQRIRQQPKEVWLVKMADRICNLYNLAITGIMRRK